MQELRDNLRENIVLTYCFLHNTPRRYHTSFPHQIASFHKGDIELSYTTHKGVLPVTLVEDMRQALIRCEPYLCTIQEKTVDKKEMLLEMWYEQARLYGKDPPKVKIEKQ